MESWWLLLVRAFAESLPGSGSLLGWSDLSRFCGKATLPGQRRWNARLVERGPKIVHSTVLGNTARVRLIPYRTA